MKNKKLLVLLLALLTVFGTFTNAWAAELNRAEAVVSQTQKFLHEFIPKPEMGTLAGEWTVLSLKRSNADIPEEYYESYYKRIETKVAQKNGKLTENKFTEYSRLIVALTSIGKDVKNVGGYNLLEPLANFKNVIKQGINGPIWALIAYDTKSFEIPQISQKDQQNSRERMIAYILEKEITDDQGIKGGWSMTGDKPDPDITAMALYALRPYISKDQKVKAASDRALDVLSKLQTENGGYISWGNENSESTAQVLIALTSLGIDPDKDPRFLKKDKNGKTSSAVDALLEFYTEGGGFKHVKDGERDGMATDQGLEGMTAYLRFKRGEKPLFDMTDQKASVIKAEGPKVQNKVQNIEDYFNDISAHWAKDTILKSKGFGINNNKKAFEPDKNITRAEFAVGLVNGLKIQKKNLLSEFSDIKNDAWYKDAVETAASNKIILGVGDDKFSPNSSISREEAMTMVKRLLEMKGKGGEVTGGAEKYLNKFPDAKDVSDWARESAAFNIDRKIILGRDGHIEPKGNITRAEAVTVIDRCINAVK